MRIDGFQWDEVNAIKNVVRHDVYPDEIEEAFYNRYRLRKTRSDRYFLYGVTDSGRYLFVLFLIKKTNRRSLVRVISARDMTRKEKNYYLKKNGWKVCRLSGKTINSNLGYAINHIKKRALI